MTEDSLQYVRNYYGVPAYKGRNVRVDGKQGVITGGEGPYVKIRIEGEKYARPYHPTDGIDYMPEGGQR